MVAHSGDDVARFKEIAIDELIKLKMISNREMITFIETHTVNGGYPSMSIKNIKNIKSIRSVVENKFPKSFYCFGILSKDKLFFQPEILCDIHKTLKELANE